MMAAEDAEQNQDKLLNDHNNRNEKYSWQCPQCSADNAIIWCCCSGCGYVNFAIICPWEGSLSGGRRRKREQIL
jgi:hypothetical protein